MKVRDLMTTNPVTCSPEDSLATAAMHMWNWDCGVVPVVDDGQLEGLLSLNDVVLEAQAESGPEHRPTYCQVIDAMQRICAHRQMPATA